MKKHHEQKELGFGVKGAGKFERGLEKDGSFNFKRTGVNFFSSFELFHWLVSITWKKFILIVGLWYFIANLFFAILYLWCGSEGIAGMEAQTSSDKFWEVFFFSSQTLTTLGYGRMAPVGHLISAVAAIESLFGLMGFALFTGLIYGRFSRAKPQILYSEKAIIAPFKGGAGLMFRMVNKKASYLLEAEVEMVVSMKAKDGGSRIFEALTLERTKINFFTLSWTIVHPIDESSQLFGMTADELEKSEAEFIIMLKAFDEGFSETVYSRTSYIASEVVWGAKFVTMLGFDERGKRVIMMDKLSAYEKADVALPVVHS